MVQRVGLHLTDRCQLDCDHCLRDPQHAPTDLPLDVISVVLRDAAQLYGIRRVSLSGGEPTLHPRFPEIIDLVVDHGMTWDMVSNGERFDRVAEWLDAEPARRESCRSIAFSVDGATDASHDAIRGEGQRRQVLAAMATCVALGIPFAVTTTLHAGNVADIEAIAAEAAALGATWVRFGMMQPTGTPLDDALGLEVGEWRAAHTRVLALARTLSIPVLAADGWPSAEPMALCGPLRGSTLHVDHRGRLSLCCMHSDLPGDDAGRTIAGDVRAGVRAPHRRLLAIQHEAIAQRLDDVGASDDAWRDFPCNSCLRRYGRPHWSSEGTRGASAVRERWRGRRTREFPNGKKNLPVVG